MNHPTANWKPPIRFNQCSLNELEGSRRNVALAIQQLAVLGELLVNRVLDNLEQPTHPHKVS